MAGSRHSRLTHEPDWIWVSMAALSVLSLASTGADANLTESPVAASEPEFQARDFHLTGPGLAPRDVTLPCRYFTVQIQSSWGGWNSLRVRRDQLHVTISGTPWDGPQRVIPVRTDVLNGPEGQATVWIVRYKLFSTLRDLSIHVRYGSDHVSGSPRLIPGPIQPSHCVCPSTDLDTWLDRQSCPVSDHTQILADLAPFPQIDMVQALSEARSRFGNPRAQSFCHYVVLNSNIFRQCYGEHVGFHMFPDAFLIFLTSVTRLPDLEFLINLGDWPLSRLSPSVKPLPIISWCKTPDFADILLPTYEITEASLECMGRQMLDMLSLQENSQVPWNQKIEQAFFRGRDSRKERLDLIRLAANHSDIMDVGITRYFFFRDQEVVLGTKESISMFDFFKYKYQISLDGTVAAYRLPYLLAGGSLIFKQDSDYMEHFYSSLKPWIHYVPIRADLSDLVDKIHWAKNHDEEAHNIAVNGRRFAQEHLLPQHVLCYHGSLFQEVARRLVQRPQVLEGMEKVDNERNKQPRGACHCSSEKDEL
ncbi:hypothetical protein TCAL_11141 [Tigriopus californicus]|uniref:Glycosyl transferase CAP10 domain-containing protein n=1 Tax=Tigriopus californicus TaxID=6832 RepID=A0A553N8M0_TIGCA|nr:protein O-glucosyltransferase 2-like [Tigriopus californicus]TRY61729.1 hypothetical protein TCAL_11141 [Tigriopus californicus]